MIRSGGRRKGRRPGLDSGILTVLLVVAACSTHTDPTEREVREPGLIAGFYADDPRIILPDTVSLGERFPIEVATFGNGCVRRGEVVITVRLEAVLVTPYDYRRPDGPCEDILLEFRHRAWLDAESPGALAIEIAGRDRERGDPVRVVRSVFVRPH